MSRSGRNNRWSKDRQRNKEKAERRRAKEAQRHLHAVENDSSHEVQHPPGFVSPYASERRKQERLEGKKRSKQKYERATSVNIELMATTIFGGKYYCVGQDRKTNSKLGA